MRILDILLEYNVYNINDIAKSVGEIAGDLPTEIVAKLVKVVQREAVNNMAFLQKMKKVPSDAPGWAT